MGAVDDVIRNGADYIWGLTMELPGWIVPALGLATTFLSSVVAYSAWTGKWAQKQEDRLNGIDDRLEDLEDLAEALMRNKADIGQVFTRAEQMEREARERHDFRSNEFTPTINKIQDTLLKHAERFVLRTEFEREIDHIRGGK